jgi:hypothetical protein
MRDFTATEETQASILASVICSLTHWRSEPKLRAEILAAACHVVCREAGDEVVLCAYGRAREKVGPISAKTIEDLLDKYLAHVAKAETLL